MHDLPVRARATARRIEPDDCIIEQKDDRPIVRGRVCCKCVNGVRIDRGIARRRDDWRLRGHTGRADEGRDDGKHRALRHGAILRGRL